MDETKSKWLSLGFLATLGQLFVSIALGLHWISSDQAAELNASLPELMGALGGLVTGALAMWGRLRATKQLT